MVTSDPAVTKRVESQLKTVYALLCVCESVYVWGGGGGRVWWAHYIVKSALGKMDLMHVGMTAHLLPRSSKALTMSHTLAHRLHACLKKHKLSNPCCGTRIAMPATQVTAAAHSVPGPKLCWLGSLVSLACWFGRLAWSTRQGKVLSSCRSDLIQKVYTAADKHCTICRSFGRYTATLHAMEPRLLWLS